MQQQTPNGVPRDQPPSASQTVQHDSVSIECSGAPDERESSYRAQADGAAEDDTP